MIKRYLPTIAISLVICQGAIQGAETKKDQPESGTYLLFGKSMFDFTEGTNAYLSGGVPLSYPVEITFDGKGDVTMDGLLGTRTPYNPATGKFDTATRSICFNTPQEYVTSFDEYVSLESSPEFETLLCAIKVYGIGYIDPISPLNFTFSEDGRSIYPSSGFGAGAAYPITQGVYTMSEYMEAIYDAVLLKKEEGLRFNIDSRKADIQNTFPNLPVSSSFRIYNTGDEASDYVIASSSPLFTISNPTGILEPGKFVDINVNFLTSEPGDYLTTITITNEEEDIYVDMKAKCAQFPDYSQIVSEGDMVFSTDAHFPWVISNEYGPEPVALNSNTGQERTNSPLYADIEVRAKHAGILTWEGYCDPFHPQRDAFTVSVDGEGHYVSPDGGGKTNSSIRIAPGKHRIEFEYVKGPIVKGTFATGKDYAWVKNISLTEEELEQNAYRVSDNRVSFQPKTIVKNGANDVMDIYIMNDGWDKFEITGSSSDNTAFYAEIPSDKFSTFDIATVKIKFHTFEAGKYTGNVTLHTTAGDIVIKCNAEAVAVPDFSPIVAEGDFDFDTTIAYPFMVEGNKAFNSTSKKKDRKQTNSMLKADFEIPEGYYGELSWIARVSCSGSEGDEIKDYASILIDGEETTQNYYGESKATQYDFAPASVNFYPGNHFICFSYTQAGDGKYEGDDRIEVSSLMLNVKKMKERDVKVWGSDVASFDDVRITKVYQREIKLANFGVRPLQITGSSVEGDFEVEFDETRFYNSLEEIPVIVTFIPKKPGEFKGSVTLSTTAGDIKIKCNATVVDDPLTLMIEDFEDDLRLWRFVDGDGDEASWDKTQMVQNAYHGEYALQSYSIHADFTEGPLDDIALSPEFIVPAEGATLEFYLACYNPSTPDRLTILAGEGEDYELVKDFDLLDARPYYNHYECSLDGLAGKKIRIAFRHVLEESVMSFIAIDDIIVTSKSTGAISEFSPSAREIDNVEYYNLQGLKVENPEEGVYIRKTRYTDGSTISEKIRITGMSLR